MNAWPYLLAAAASLLYVAAARAQEPGVHFIWERPAASLCPTRSVLESDVEGEMGRRVFSAAADARVIIHGVIEEGGSGVRAHFDARTTRGEPLGTRDLSAPAGQCASLRGAIGLVLILFVEYDEPSNAQFETRFGLGAESSLASEPFPRLAVSAGPAMLLELGRVLQLRVNAAYWLPVSIETLDGTGANFQAFSLALRACARIWGGLGLCVGGESGAVIANPLQLRGPARQVRLLAHGLVDARWEAHLGSVVRAGLAAGPLLSFSRPAYSYFRTDGERMAVYRPRLLGIILQISIIILSP